MSDPKEELDGKLAVLVSRLPRRAVRALIDELHGAGDRSARAGAARSTLIAQLNQPRPNRARRLFTTLVEPLLADDPLLLDAGGSEALPGLVQRADVAGWWAALLENGLASAADAVQARLDALCADMVIDDVFRTPEAEALRERLRHSALEVIAAAEQPARKRTRFLAAVNAARNADIAAKRGSPAEPPPLTWKAVEQLRDLLAASERMLPVLAELAPRIRDRAAASDTASEQAALAAAIAALVERLPEEPMRSAAIVHATAIALHRRLRYDLVLPVLRAHGPGEDRAWLQLASALTGHLRGAARALARGLESACRQADGGEAVTLDAAARSALDALLQRYAEVLETVVQAGLADHRALRFPVRAACDELQVAIETTVVPRLVARVAAAGAARLQPAADHDDAVRLAGWVSGWTRAMTRAALVGGTTVTWRDDLIGMLRKAFEGAIRLEPGADLPLRMRHIVRLHELVSSLDGDLATWLTVISVNTLAIIRRRLEEPGPLTPAEAEIARRFLGLVEAEMKRTRHWQVADLAAFRDMARRRLAA